MTNSSSNSRKRVLSGMRPTGKLHLGNYVGALKNWVGLQHTHECFFFVADWHALTTDYDDTSRLADNTLEVILDYLAAGLDPEKCTIFVQSHVPQHAELHLLFSMITSLGWLERVPSYKEQQQNMPDKDLHTYGFLGYPLLQAADILIYRPQFVPVGQDQAAHVELTREVARRFNSFFPKWGPLSRFSFAQGAPPTPVSALDPVFPEPEVLLTPSPKLLGTDKRKMSKSYGNSILLSEEAAQLSEKIKNSVTDRPKLTDRGSPDRCPVGNLHQIFSDANTLAYITEGCTQATITCEHCKALAIPATDAHLAPIRDRRRRISEDKELLKRTISEGNEKARKAAEDTMMAVRQAVGLLNSESLTRWVPALSLSYPSIASRDAVAWLPTAELESLNHTERGEIRRENWLENIGKNYPLRAVGHRTYVTRRNRRIGVPTSGEHGVNRWHFTIGDRHYDALALLCHLHSGELIDFVVPMNFLGRWKSFRREGKNVVFDVTQSDDQFLIESGPGITENITSFLGNHSALE